MNHDEDEELRKTLPEFFHIKGPEQYPDCLVDRGCWGALPRPEIQEKVEFPVKNVLFTHTDTDTCDSKVTCKEIVRTLQRKHMDEGLSDIKYNFLVGGDGNVYEGRGWKMKPEVSLLYPEIAESFLDIGYIGYKGIRPEKKQNYAGKSLVKYSINFERIEETATYYSDL